MNDSDNSHRISAEFRRTQDIALIEADFVIRAMVEQGYRAAFVRFEQAVLHHAALAREHFRVQAPSERRHKTPVAKRREVQIERPGEVAAGAGIRFQPDRSGEMSADFGRQVNIVKVECVFVIETMAERNYREAFVKFHETLSHAVWRGRHGFGIREDVRKTGRVIKVERAERV